MNITLTKPREIRVFLSSTFKDMERERQFLAEIVFPDIRSYCSKRNLAFTEIDLRWGITEEESSSGHTLEICLEEIDRCRKFPPFFIGFLGERYGWIPTQLDLANYKSQHADSAYSQSIQEAVLSGLSATELEMGMAALDVSMDAQTKGHVLFLLRAKELTRQFYAEGAPTAKETDFYNPAGSRLEGLKQRIRQSGCGCIDGYADLEAFGNAIRIYLTSRIDAEFPVIEVQSPFELSEAAHAAFAASRLESGLESNPYVQRQETLDCLRDALAARIRNAEQGPLLLTGPSGQGKSTVLADFARYCRASFGQHVVIEHYVGADDTRNLNTWLERLFSFLKHRFPDTFLNDLAPQGDDQRQEAIAPWIARACQSREQVLCAEPGSVRFILFVDALDQLQNEGRYITNLAPNLLGAKSIVFASCIEGSEAWDTAKDREWQTIKLPLLSPVETRQLIDAHQARFRKGFSNELKNRLVENPAMGVPLFNRLVLEKLRRSAKHVDIGQWIERLLAHQDIGSLFVTQFLTDYPDSKRQDIALNFLGLIAVARDGLYEIELRYLLASPSDPADAITHLRLLPPSELSRLLSHFQPYLLRRDGRLLAMHKSLGEAAMKQIGESSLRRKLVKHFSNEWENKRNLDRLVFELPTQLWMLGDKGDDSYLLSLLIEPDIATRLCSKNRHEFAIYWQKVAGPANTATEWARKLVKNLLEQQDAKDVPWAVRARQSIEVAHAFLDAGEVNWASRLYHGPALQGKMLGGRIPADSLKEALRGFVQCFLKRVQETADMSMDEQLSGQSAHQELDLECIALRETSLDFLERLKVFTNNDSCADKAEDALQRFEVRKACALLSSRTDPTHIKENIELQRKDVYDAFEALRGDGSKHKSLVHATRAKAYVCNLNINLEEILYFWHDHQKRGSLIPSALSKAYEAKDYVKQYLDFGHPQRIYLLEHMHVLLVKVAEAANSSEERESALRSAVEFADETRLELKRSYFSDDLKTLRFLNAAETTILARENGYVVPGPLISNLQDEATYYQSVSTPGTATANFATEIIQRLAQIDH